MSSLWPWVKAMRLKSVLMGISIYIVAAKLNNWIGFSYIIVAYLFFLGIATMVGNDYDDRIIDRVKGKTFASDNEKKYLKFSIILWVLVWLLIFLVLITNDLLSGIISIIMCFLCMNYTIARKMEFIPAIYVSLVSVSPIFYFIAVTKENKILWIYIALIFFILYVRENIKDLIDKDVDNNQGNILKWTLPAVYGERTTLWIMIFISVVIIALSYLVNRDVAGIALVGWLGTFFILFIKNGQKAAKYIFDFTLLIMLIMFFS